MATEKMRRADDRISVGIRLDRAVKEAGQRAAEEDRRSFSVYIELLIERDVEQRRQKQRPPKS